MNIIDIIQNLKPEEGQLFLQWLNSFLGDIMKRKPETDMEIVERQFKEDYPGWEYVSCDCCGGLEWGGEYPRECSLCDGSGSYVRHIKSGVLAMYPGGPFIGSEPK